jgi:DNA polymerase-3 subunit alpha
MKLQDLIDHNDPKQVKELKIIESLPEFIEDRFIKLYNICKEQKVIGSKNEYNSYIAYKLNITSKPPRGKFTIPRKSFTLPDIDIDFTVKGKAELIEYLINKYGKDNVMHIGTYQAFKMKAALRDVGKILEIPKSDLEFVQKMFKGDEGDNLTIKDLNELYSVVPEIIPFAEKYPKWFEYAERLLGVYRSQGEHASGVIISNHKIEDYTAIMLAKDGERNCQLDMKSAEKVGLVKFDILTLSTLDILQSVERLIGGDFKIDQIPLDDSETYDMIGQGNTVGVFQLSSGMMRNLCKQIKPRNLHEISDINAIGRPAILKLGMDAEYISVKNKDKESIDYHPVVNNIINKTHGVMLYQEQMMLIAEKLAGFDSETQNILRKACGKKNPTLMKEQKDKFISSSISYSNIGQQVAERVWELIEKQAYYSFCFGHSLAYSLLGYYTAYIKCHYPEIFAVSMLGQLGSKKTGKKEAWEDKIRGIISFIRQQGIVIMAPDINDSYKEFTLDSNNNIRYGLEILNGVTEKAIDFIIKNRPYLSFEDFVNIIEKRLVDKTAVRALVNSGAFDSIESNRSLLNRKFDIFYASSKKKKTELGNKQLDPITITDIIRLQTELCYCDFSHNIIKGEFDSFLMARNFDNIEIAGSIYSYKLDAKTKKGKDYIKFQLSTDEGIIDCFCFEESKLESIKKKMSNSNLVIVTGKKMKPFRLGGDSSISVKQVKLYKEVDEDAKKDNSDSC